MQTPFLIAVIVASAQSINFFTSTCFSNQFTCSNLQCIPENKRCDNHNDCTDGSDEKECGKI